MTPDIIIQLQHLLATVLPIALSSGIGVTINGLLASDKLPSLWNAAIAYVCIGVFALLSVFASGRLTGDYSYDFTLLVASATVLMSAGLSPLKHYLQSNFGFGVTKDPLASRSVPTTQSTQQTLPSVQLQVQQARYQSYASQQTEVAPAQSTRGYDVDVPPTTSSIPPRKSRVTPTSGGVASNAYAPQQQFQQQKRTFDNGG